MRVLMIDVAFTTPQGVADTRSFDMAQYLLARGHAVTVLCAQVSGAYSGLEGPFLRGVRRGNFAGLHVIQVAGAFRPAMPVVERLWVSLQFVWRACREVLTEPHEVVLSVVSPLASVVPALFARWVRRKYCIVELRDRIPPRAILNPLIRWPMHWLERFYGWTAHRTIALTPSLARTLVGLGAASEKVVLIPPASSYVPPSAPTIVPPEGQVIATYIGALDTAHDIDSVLDAAALLKQRGRNDIQILLIGEGSCKADLMDRVRYETLENVHIHTPKKRHTYSDLLHTAQIGLEIRADIPALYQGASNAEFCNYVAAGLPVIVNYPAWAAELVTQHECGIVVMAQNAPALADALERLASDREMYAYQAAKASALAVREFSPAVIAKRYAETLESLHPERGSYTQ